MTRTRNQRRAFGRIIQRLGVGHIMCAIDGAPRVGSWLGRIMQRIPDEAPQRQLLPLKHIRLRELANQGFNYVDFRFWLRNTLNISELKEFFETHGSISLRTFTEERLDQETPKLPVAYSMRDWDSILEFCVRNNHQYHTLVNQSLPLEHSLLAGRIVIDGKWVSLDAFEGYGTPRDADERISRLKVHQGTFGDPMSDWVPQELAEVAVRLRDFQPILPVTFEYSLYPYPIGVRKTPIVLWEWRGGSAYDLRAMISRLLLKTRDARHSVVIEIPETSR